MSAVGAPTHPDAGKPRPDFCIGDLHGKTTSPQFRALVVDTLRGLGYSVAVNEPYVGNVLIGRNSDPARGIDSVQIEINKKLFMDGKTFRVTAGLAKVKADLDTLLRIVADDTRKRFKA